MRYAIVYRDEDGNWIAEVPSLPGCVSQGDTRDEAIENIKEAATLYLESLEEDRKDLYREFIDPELVALEMVTE
jgi:predicted RNase H-like HicB family nuclease